MAISHARRAMSQFSHMYKNRQWKALRASQLQAKPLCEDCQDQGRIELATVCDHIEPHKGDIVKFWKGPFRSLCKYHHDVKTIMEDGGLNSGANTHPEWLPLPACPVVLVTGPPGSGKTTYCREQAKAADQVIDLDECFLEVSGVHGHQADRAYLSKALRLRNKLLANLAGKQRGTAYVIVSCPTTKEVEWWKGKLGATHERLDPGMATCLERVSANRRQAVREWYDKAARNDWTPKVRRIGCDVEGWPA